MNVIERTRTEYTATCDWCGADAGWRSRKADAAEHVRELIEEGSWGWRADRGGPVLCPTCKRQQEDATECGQAAQEALAGIEGEGS